MWVHSRADESVWTSLLVDLWLASHPLATQNVATTHVTACTSSRHNTALLLAMSVCRRFVAYAVTGMKCIYVMWAVLGRVEHRYTYYKVWHRVLWTMTATTLYRFDDHLFRWHGYASLSSLSRTEIDMHLPSHIDWDSMFYRPYHRPFFFPLLRSLCWKQCHR